MIHARCVAVLETMWGEAGQAPGMFRINPNNYTGRRLYWLLGHEDLWATNACREQVANANEHGTPDPDWLAMNLKRLTYDLLLVCGKVAQDTYRKCGYVPDCRVLCVPHPAARFYWNRKRLDRWRDAIRKGVH